MKKTGIIIFIAALAVGVVIANFFDFSNFGFKSPISFSFGKEKGSGNVVTEKRGVSNFSKVDVSGIFKVEIVAQKDFSLEIEADDNLLPLIKTSVEGETLKIEKEKSFSSKKTIVIRISAPNIESLEVSGVSKINFSNIDNESLLVDSSGASRISVSGKTNKLVVNMSGASRVKAAELKASSVSVDGSGASRAKVFASEEISADLSGASSVSYSGTPTKINKKTSGASRITQVN